MKKLARTNVKDLSKINMVTHVEIKEIKEHSDDVEHDFIIEGFASTEDLDRGGDITHAEAFNKTLKAFMAKNPIVLFMHDMKQPIGTVLEAVIKPGKGLHVKAFISKTEEKIRTKIRENILRAFSFGFVIEKSTEEEVGRGKRPNRHLTLIELLEISVVSIGMNANALFSLAKSLEWGSDLVYTGTYVEDLENKFNIMSGEVKELQNEVEELGTIKLTLESETQVKTVVPFKDWGTVPESTTWNGPAEIRKADIPTLKNISTWFDSSAPDVKGSFKLPHHQASDLKSVWNAVRAAMGALLGARGGVNIPDKDRKGVYNHLVKEYAHWNKTPPAFKDYSDLELKDLAASGTISFEDIKDVDLEKYTEENFVEDIEGKAGRVLSAKNKKLLTTCADALEGAQEAIKTLINADVKPDNTTDEEELPKQLQVVKYSEEIDISDALENECAHLVSCGSN